MDLSWYLILVGACSGAIGACRRKSPKEAWESASLMWRIHVRNLGEGNGKVLPFSDNGCGDGIGAGAGYYKGSGDGSGCEVWLDPTEGAGTGSGGGYSKTGAGYGNGGYYETLISVWDGTRWVDRAIAQSWLSSTAHRLSS